MKKLYTLSIVLLSIITSSCKSYKEVNTFSARSSESLQVFNDISCDFSTNCIDKCYLRALEDKKFSIKIPDCKCTNEKQADENILRIINALDAYFKSIQAISSNDFSTSVSYDAIANPLIENDFVKQEDIQSYKSLSEVITGIILENYRSNELESEIEKAYPDVEFLLKKLKEIVENNLIPTLENRRGELQQVYADNYSDNLNSTYDRFSIKERYFKELTKIDEKEAKLNAYSESLEKIIMGRQTLHYEFNHIDSESTKKSISHISSLLYEIYNQIK